jgi:hypothetical protein
LRKEEDLEDGGPNFVFFGNLTQDEALKVGGTEILLAGERESRGASEGVLPAGTF